MRCGSVLRNHWTAQVEAIVQADLHDMVLGAEAAERGQRGRDREARAAEVVELVLDLGRPVLGEQVLETGADRETVLTVAGKRKGDRDAADLWKELCVARRGNDDGRNRHYPIYRTQRYPAFRADVSFKARS